MTTAPTMEIRDDVWETLKLKLGLNEARARAGKSSSSGWNSQNLLAPCSDGQRTAHLTGLAGSYIARGFNVDQVIEHCLLWNERNTPPLDPDKVISTCHSIGASDARNHPNRNHSQAFTPLQAAMTPPVPWFDIADARIDGYLLVPPPPMRWVLNGFLPLGIVAALVAQGGVGKSQLLMQLAYSLATGIALAGQWPVGETGSVLMLCAEDSGDEIHRRVHRIHKQLGSGLSPAMQAKLKDNFLIRSMTGIDVLLTQAMKNGEIVRTQLVEQLLLTAQQAKNLKLIIIDPAARFRGGDENSNPHATRFVQVLEYLALTTGATVLIAHHTGKGATNSKETNQDASRGASALTDGIRWQMALTSLTSSSKRYKGLPPNARHRYMVAKLVKTNYTAPQPEVLLFRGDDGYLQVIADPSATTPKFIQDKLDQLSVLRILQNDPKGLTARQLETRHGGLAKDLKISEKALRELVTNARFEGLVDGDKGRPLTLTEKAVEFLKTQSGGACGAARQAPRGNATRRTKTE